MINMFLNILPAILLVFYVVYIFLFFWDDLTIIYKHILLADAAAAIWYFIYVPHNSFQICGYIYFPLLALHIAYTRLKGLSCPQRDA